MTGIRKTRQASGPRPGSGFTLIELLAVIAILAVLVALVVGVGMKIQAKAARDQTRNTMDILIVGACGCLYNVSSEYPPDHETSSTFTFSPDTGPAPTSNGSVVLFMFLTGQHYKDTNFSLPLDRDLTADLSVKAARPKLDKLPSSVFTFTTHGFKDGFGTIMRYQLQGGKPLLTSAGPDATFGTGDDIRSDAR